MTSYTVPSAIKSDGSKEVSADINYWLYGLPNGTLTNPVVVNFPVYANYWTDDTVSVVGKVNWLIYGKGTTFTRKLKGGLRKAEHMLFQRCTHVTARHMFVQGSAPKVSGYDPRFEAQHGFSMESCRDMNLVDCDAKDVWGDKFYFTSDAPGAPWTSDVTLDGCGGTYSHRHHITVAAGRNIVAQNADMGKCARTFLDLEPPGAQGGADIVKLFYLTGTQKNNFIAAIGQRGGDVTNIEARNCNSNKITIVIGGTGKQSNFAIIGNVGTEGVGNNTGAVMQFNGVDGTLDVVDNHQPMNKNRVTGLPMRMARWDDYTEANATITYENNTEDIA